MRLEDDLDQAGKTERVITLNKVVPNLMSAITSEICYILFQFKSGNYVTPFISRKITGVLKREYKIGYRRNLSPKTKIMKHKK
jgi:hypothetical protein